MICSIDKRIPFCWISKFLRSTSRHTVHNNVFSTWNKLIILESSLESAACEFKYCKLIKNLVTPICSNFTICKFKQLFGSPNFLWERFLQISTSCQSFYSTANTITSRKIWKPMQEFFYSKEQSSLRSASLVSIVTSRHISKANILKECSLRFKPIYPVSLMKFILTLSWLTMDYISKCDVILVVIKGITPSKNIFNCL